MLDNQKARGVAAHVVDPVARLLLRIGLQPNHVTVITALATSMILLLTWPSGNFLLGALIAMPFVFGDLLDGTMARLSGSVSPFGNFLDSVLDRVTDAVIFGTLTFYFISVGDNRSATFGLVALVTALLISYIRAKADAIGADAKVGLMERSERLAVLSLAVLLEAFGVSMVLEYSVILISILNAFTIFQRLQSVRRSLHAGQ